MNDTNSEKPQVKKKRRWGFFILLAFLAAATPLAMIGWAELPRVLLFFELEPPQIRIRAKQVRGIGLTPVTLQIELLDTGAGLDEVVVQTQQRGNYREVLRERLLGKPKGTIQYEFPGIKSELEEGFATIEVRVFDRSFFSNSAEKSVMLKVDYRKPKIEPISTQHNARQGGSQLVIYRAFDEELEISGVKVGSQTFLGYPARGIDSGFGDPSLHIAFYGIDILKPVAQQPIKLFAVDGVGNASSSTFYNKALSYSGRRNKVAIDEGFLRGTIAELADHNFSLLQKVEQQTTGRVLQYQTEKGSRDRLIEQFKLVNNNLRQYDNDQLFSLLTQEHFSRDQKLWEGSFQRQPGNPVVRFGDQISYDFSGQIVGTHTSTGYEIRNSAKSSILAANSGVVIFSGNLGTYGRLIVIDHGLGLVSIYSRLDSATVREGDQVTKGQAIGLMGLSGLTQTPHLYFEMRLQGVPVDAVEWWDASWVAAHIEAKINEAKKSLGITRYVPLR
ncbi:MAG: M23 family metallopeptidase [Bdellovibrionales bacterium]|nr:M23 family metallopeptidase [Bdellovibrionales bacterium]